MIRRSARMSFAIPFVAVLVACYHPGRGFVESQFDLVLNSRFPKFFDAPAGANPHDYRARVTYYSSPDSVRVVIRDRAGRKVFDETGTVRWHPLDDKEHPAAHHPNHTVVSFGSRVDIFEQRRPEPLEYLSDDKVLWDAIEKGAQPTAGTLSR